MVSLLRGVTSGVVVSRRGENTESREVEFPGCTLEISSEGESLTECGNEESRVIVPVSGGRTE